MNRRDLLIAAAAAMSCSPAGIAQVPKLPKIGFLSWFPRSMKHDLDRFEEGMQQLGYTENRDYEVEAYFTAGDPELTREMARRLIERPVDVIVAVATPAVHIIKEATQTIPIVMVSANALATGLVPSLSHPGSNLTGVSLLMTDTAGKRLEILRQTKPNLHAVAFLGSAKDPNTATFVHETQAAADSLGIKLIVRLIDGPQAINQAVFDAMKQDGSEAVIAQPIFTGYQDQVVPMAMKAGLPVTSDWSVFADAGALFTYGASQPAGIRRTAYYVDRILKGAKPADLPVEQPTEMELVVNVKTAKSLGLTVPQSLLAQADEVIE